MLRHRKERIASAKVGVVRDSLTSSSSPPRGPDDIDFREVFTEIRPRKDKRGVDLISDALPFGRL
jgi:hypothetical protein